jgi:hypothetical protein
MWKAVSLSCLCLLYLGTLTISLSRPSSTLSRTGGKFVVVEDDYESDIKRLIALRSHSLDELLTLADQLERKWSRISWDHYARVMVYVCSEIANHGLNNERVREQTEHFARVALSHSRFYSWEHESDLVGWLGYQRSSAKEAVWLHERREKTTLWLRVWQRLDREIDPTFNTNDRSRLPSPRVYPPVETGLPAGTPPSAIKDLRVRARYEAAIAENNRKAKAVQQQLPLVSHGPAFKAQAERWLIQAYSQPPFRNAELKRFLDIYVYDKSTRQRILSEVEKNSK